MKKVLYYGWIGNRNLGDEALFDANRQLFGGVRFIRCDSLFWSLRRPRVCLLGGGTYINEKVSVEPLKSIQARMPLIINGAGVMDPGFWSGVPRCELARTEWNGILRNSALVGVRGPDSMKTLRDQGFEDARIVGDPVLLLADREPQKGLPSKRIGLNFGVTYNDLWGLDDELVYKVFKELAAELLGGGYEVSLISVYPPDIHQIRRLAREFNGGMEIFEAYEFGSDVMEYFRDIDVLVGEKLHSVILAHCAYTPAVMIEYRPKCVDYMNSMELADFNFRCDALEPESVLDAVARLVDDPVEYSDRLAEKIPYYIQKQKEFAAEATDFIQGSWK